MTMYKAIQNKKYYLAVNKFNVRAKTISKVYLSGVRIFQTDDMKYYSIVAGTFRIMFGIKKQQLACNCG